MVQVIDPWGCELLGIGMDLTAVGLQRAGLITLFFQRVDNSTLELTVSNLVRSQRPTQQTPAKLSEKAKAGFRCPGVRRPFVKPLGCRSSPPGPWPFAGGASVDSGTDSESGKIALSPRGARICIRRACMTSAARSREWVSRIDWRPRLPTSRLPAR